jgi:hypothetical protein
MTTVIFEYNGKSKEIPIDEIKSVNDVADAYATLGLKTKQPIKRRLYYTLPNGKYHSFLSNKNHKYAVACTREDTGLGFCYTDDYAKAKTTAANWTNKFNNAKEGFRKFVVIDVQEVE